MLVTTDKASLQTYVNPTLVRQLKYIALIEGRSVSNIVQQLMTDYVAAWRDPQGRPVPELL